MTISLKKKIKQINENLLNRVAISSTFSIPIALYVPLARNLINMTKHRHFLIRVLQSSLCKHYSSRTSYHSKKDWVPYQRKLCHKSPD